MTYAYNNSDFDPDGSLTGETPASGTSVVSQDVLFTGRTLDRESKLFFYRARYYDPEIARFMQRDPIATWGDYDDFGSAYSYAQDDPVNGLDMLGLTTYRPYSGSFGSEPILTRVQTDNTLLPYNTNTMLHEIFASFLADGGKGKGARLPPGIEISNGSDECTEAKLLFGARGYGYGPDPEKAYTMALQNVNTQVNSRCKRYCQDKTCTDDEED